jgi:hypothetical protein
MIRAHVARKYEVEFDEFPYPADDFLEFIEDLRDSEYDIIAWNNLDGSAFELDVEELLAFKEDECDNNNSVYARYIDYIVDNAPEGASWVRIELF